MPFSDHWGSYTSVPEVRSSIISQTTIAISACCQEPLLHLGWVRPWLTGLSTKLIDAMIEIRNCNLALVNPVSYPLNQKTIMWVRLSQDCLWLPVVLLFKIKPNFLSLSLLNWHQSSTSDLNSNKHITLHYWTSKLLWCLLTSPDLYTICLWSVDNLETNIDQLLMPDVVS